MSLISTSSSVTPLVLFSILDHFTRRDDGNEFVIGILLGTRMDEKKEIQIKNCFPLNILRNENETMDLDFGYIEQTANYHQRVNNKETIIGWYSTGSEISLETVEIHKILLKKFGFQPVLLMVDTKFENKQKSLNPRTFVRYIERLFFVLISISKTSEKLGTSFYQVDCVTHYDDAERGAIKVIGTKNVDNLSHKIHSDMDNLEDSLKKILELLTTVSSYIDSVLEGKEDQNKALGRFISDTISSIPKIDKDVFEKMFNNHLQDILMVVYLSNLTRAQLVIAERLQSVL
ncbi:hypothetical protein HK099_003273 [Clydaea vesicula]|uniref:MPN domain-containing protein n=1 Tax=Clydaea vesicula TaxID=447962 RepID=A0AAD5XYX6_9FUNG|nr:hypothetical protein HK099_003273 [Clydaea vesicula]